MKRSIVLVSGGNIEQDDFHSRTDELVSPLYNVHNYVPQR